MYYHKTARPSLKTSPLFCTAVWINLHRLSNFWDSFLIISSYIFLKRPSICVKTYNDERSSSLYVRNFYKTMWTWYKWFYFDCPLIWQYVLVNTTLLAECLFLVTVCWGLYNAVIANSMLSEYSNIHIYFFTRNVNFQIRITSFMYPLYRTIRNMNTVCYCLRQLLLNNPADPVSFLKFSTSYIELVAMMPS